MTTFRIGDLVRFYDGDLGFVIGYDKEWDPVVYWFTENIEAPCYGTDLTLVSRNK